jgi:hypothetical protein
MATKLLALAAAMIVAVLFALAPAPTFAEEDEVPCKPNVMCLEGNIIYGNVPTPSVVFVLDRGRLEVQRAQADRSFTRDVVESVDQAPF